MRSTPLLVSLLAALAAVACDSAGSVHDSDAGARAPEQTVAVDRIFVPGACPSQDDLAFVELSLVLSGDGGAKPTDELDGGGLLRDLVQPHVFEFTGSGDQGVAGPLLAEGEATGTRRGADVEAESVRFDYSGGVGRAGDDRLVALLVDQSGSLIGQDPTTQQVDVAKASDPNGLRLAFLKSFVMSVNPDHWLSLVWFGDSFPTLTAEQATPTRDRAVTQAGIDDLARDESGGTPLADALDLAHTRLLDSAANADLNPVVLLLTDGVEDGDLSVLTLEEVTDQYAARTPAPVPVIVLHFQPPEGSGLPRGRDAALQRLACRSGGEYIFLESAGRFTDSDLLRVVLDRLDGAWRLRVRTTLASPDFPADGYLLSTDLTATIGGRALTARLAAPDDNQANDTRIWLEKR